MATTVTRFEVQVPQFASSTDRPSYDAVNTFLGNMGTLCEFVLVQNELHSQPDITIVDAFVWVIYGIIQTTQQATALGFLNTLNSALVTNGKSPVVCIAWNVQSEP